MGVGRRVGQWLARRHSADPKPRFELVTREDCHLCHDMRELLEQVLPPLGLELELVDVDRDPALSERFGETVPVLLRDGRPVAKVRLTEAQLLRIIRRRRE